MKTMKKKIITLCLVIAMLSVAVIGGTLAYFTDVEQATNEFTVGKVDIDLYETVGHVDGATTPNSKDNAIKVNGQTGAVLENIGKDTEDEENDEDFTVTYGPAMPGDVLTKTVTVENTGDEPAYIAIAISQENYGKTYEGTDWTQFYASKSFNNRIDNYYEGNTYTWGNVTHKEIADFTPYTDTQMQGLISDIFTGDDWNVLNYGKTSDNNSGIPATSDVRYYPSELDLAAAGPNAPYSGNAVQLIAVDYAVQGQGKYQNNILPAEAYDAATRGCRMWVYMYYVPAGEKVVLDLEISIPTVIDEFSLGAFDGMILDVQAAAIQTSGFDSARAAFEALVIDHDLKF